MLRWDAASGVAGLPLELASAALLLLGELRSLAAAAAVARGWAAAVRREELWWVVVRRLLSGAETSEDDSRALAEALAAALGPCAAARRGHRGGDLGNGGAAELRPGVVARLLSRAVRAAAFPLRQWSPPPSEAQEKALGEMPDSAVNFLFGLAHGIMPSFDGLFTYHCYGATPIHYRFELDDGCEGEEPGRGGPGGGLRLAGRWSWSPDREQWFPSSTHDITRGLFGGGGWRLVADNRLIVSFLEAWPLLPLFAAPLRLPRGLAPAPSAARSAELLLDFRRAVRIERTGGQPSTACVKLNVFTVHLLQLPPVLITVDDDGWAVSELSAGDWPPGAAPPELQALLEGLGQEEFLDVSLASAVSAFNAYVQRFLAANPPDAMLTHAEDAVHRR